MNIKPMFQLSLILALAAVPLTVFAQETSQAEPGPFTLNLIGNEPGSISDADVESSVEIGLYNTTQDDSPDMAAEYYDTNGGITANAMISSHSDSGSLEFVAAFQSADTQAGAFNFDLGRTWRSKNTYQKFIHRLGHDPMTNLEATSTNGKVVWHTDLRPDQEYQFNYSVLSSSNELQFEGLDALTIGLDVREQKRRGHTQAYTTSHCDNCHIYSQGHPIDETTTDATVDAKLAWNGGYAKAAFTARSLSHGTSSVPATFDDALHPELQVPVFDNRLQFDSDVGTVPADMWPDIDKNKTRLDLVFTDVGGFTITGNGVFSETENKYTNLKSDYRGYILTAAKGWKNGWRLRWRGRAYSIDNDDVFIDVNDRPGIAGPHAGQTFEDVWGVNFDHVRMSALNRDAFESKADLSYRFGRKTGTMRFIWDYDTVDRENFQVLPGEFETTKNLLGASYRVRPAKGWNFEANVKYASVDNAFMLIDGACSTLVSDRYPNPWNPETPQYYQFHEARIADTTASASSWMRADLRAGYSTGNTTFFGKYIYYDGDNNDGDLTDWSRESSTALVTVWSAPTENMNWYATLSWIDSDLDVPACIPVFDG
jgi:hypothetical protein